MNIHFSSSTVSLIHQLSEENPGPFTSLKMSDEEYNGWYHTRYGFYPPDEKDSNIVTAANKGDLKQIKRILSQSQGSKKTALLNHAKKWTEPWL